MALPNVSMTYIEQMSCTQVTGSSGAQTNATATASLPAVAQRTNFITGFDVEFSGTIAAAVTATLTGIGSGTCSYQIGTTTTFPYVILFPYPMAATNSNQAITLSVPALGASGVCTCNVYGMLN
jgi:hypothetical protein